MRALLLSMLLLLTAISGRGQEPLSQVALDSFNYWELSFQIVRSEAIRNALEIAPWQVAAISDMRGDKEMERLYAVRYLEIENQREREAKEQEAAADLERSLRNIPTDDAATKKLRVQQRIERAISAANGHNAVLVSLNDVVEGKLRKILTDEKIRLLRPTAMRLKFTKGYMPFADREVIEYAGMSDAEARIFAAQVDAHKGSYEGQVAQLKNQYAQRVLNAIPPASLQLFYETIGNSLAPNASVSAQVDLGAIPFPPLTQLTTVLDSAELQNAIQLSPGQRVRLVEIREKYFSDIRTLPKGKRMSQHIDDCTIVLSESANRVLTNQQAVILARRRALEAFLNDYSTPFSQASVVHYLRLTEEEAKALVCLATEETDSVRQKIVELDEEVFLKLSSQLPASAAQRVREMFAGVWSIDLPKGTWVSSM